MCQVLMKPPVATRRYERISKMDSKLSAMQERGGFLGRVKEGSLIWLGKQTHEQKPSRIAELLSTASKALDVIRSTLPWSSHSQRSLDKGSSHAATAETGRRRSSTSGAGAVTLAAPKRELRTSVKVLLWAAVLTALYRVLSASGILVRIQLAAKVVGIALFRVVSGLAVVLWAALSFASREVAVNALWLIVHVIDTPLWTLLGEAMRLHVWAYGQLREFIDVFTDPDSLEDLDEFFDPLTEPLYDLTVGWMRPALDYASPKVAFLLQWGISKPFEALQDAVLSPIWRQALRYVPFLAYLVKR